MAKVILILILDGDVNDDDEDWAKTLSLLIKASNSKSSRGHSSSHHSCLGMCLFKSRSSHLQNKFLICFPPNSFFSSNFEFYILSFQVGSHGTGHMPWNGFFRKCPFYRSHFHSKLNSSRHNYIKCDVLVDFGTEQWLT